MFSIFFCFILLFLILMGLGSLCYRFLGINLEKINIEDFGSLIWTGLTLLICYLQIHAIFFPINYTSLILASLFSFFGFSTFIRLETKANLFKVFLIFGFFAILISYLALGPIRWYDTGLYHLQTVKWLREYGFVTGLGNLHGRFAFNNSFHIFAAFTESFFTIGRSSHIALSFLFVCAFFDYFINLFFTKNRKRKIFIFLTLPFLIYKLSFFELTSLSSDGAVLLAYFCLIMRIAGLSDFALRSVYPIIFLSLLAVSFKLNAAPAAFFILFFMFILLKNDGFKKRHLPLFVFIATFTFGYCARNFIQAGWFTYPFEHLQYPVSWSIPVENVIGEKQWIQSWSRIPRLSPDEVLGHGFYHWFSPWFSQFRHTIEFYILVLFPIVIVFSKWNFRQLIFLSILLLNIVFWFQMAPELRFGAIFIWAAFGWLISESRPYFFNQLKPILVTIVVAFLGYINWFQRTHFNTKIEFSFFQIPEPPQEQMESLPLPNSNLTLYKPIKGTDRCFDAPLPCTPYLRGFRLRKFNMLESGFEPIVIETAVPESN